MSFSETTVEQVREKFPFALSLREVEVENIQRSKHAPAQCALYLHPLSGGDPPQAFLIYREDLRRFAREVLLHLDPSPNDQILEAIRRIEDLLRKS